MLNHVLCVKLRDASEVECQALCEHFMTMKGRVPVIRDIEAGYDILHSERSYDVVLIVTLDDAAALLEYQADPYHANVIKPYVHERRISSVTVDYEF